MRALHSSRVAWFLGGFMVVAALVCVAAIQLHSTAVASDQVDLQTSALELEPTTALPDDGQPSPISGAEIVSIADCEPSLPMAVVDADSWSGSSLVTPLYPECCVKVIYNCRWVEVLPGLRYWVCDYYWDCSGCVASEDDGS